LLTLGTLAQAINEQVDGLLAFRVLDVTQTVRWPTVDKEAFHVRRKLMFALRDPK
jgi:hypothetical protein